MASITNHYHDNGLTNRDYPTLSSCKSYLYSELFHFCMLTSIIGKKVSRTKLKHIYVD